MTFDNQIANPDGKGQKDRVTLLPAIVKERLQEHLNEVRRLDEKDLAEGFGSVFLPGALARKVHRRRAGVGLAICVSGINSESREGAAAQFGEIISMSRWFNGRSERRFVGRG